ncbi:MAG: beta-phosphoglucomutase [Planctomycetota bacterium]
MVENTSDESKAVIFDLDGVLVSTDEYHYRSWQQMADEEGIPFDREFNHRFRGVSRMECLDMLLEQTDRDYTDTERQKLADRKNGYYREMIAELSPQDMLPGARGTIDELQDRKVDIAVASGSKNAPFIMDKIGLKNEIETLVCGLDIENSKPHPEVFLKAAEQLGARPERSLVVEDAQSGIEAANRAGMHALGIGEHELHGADQTVPSLADISVDAMLDIIG